MGLICMFDMYPLVMKQFTQPTKVWTENPKDMLLFLTQHGFDPKRAHVKVVEHTEEYEQKPIGNKKGLSLLNRYIFGSRDDKTLHTVVTTEEILTSILTNVAIDLSGVMTLGACALRGDIQIFAPITDLIEELDPIYVKDTHAADVGCNEEERLERIGDWLKEYPNFESYAVNEDDTFLYERLYDSMYPGKVQMITLESYVSIFTRLYIIGHDDYDRPQGDEFDV